MAGLLKIAIALQEHGYSVLPLGRDKMPYWEALPTNESTGKRTWQPFREQAASQEQVKGWFDGKKHLNLGIIGGAVSGGLVVIDFDEAALFPAWLDMISQPLRDSLTVVQTGKGFHVYLRCTERIMRNTGLAWSVKRSKDGAIRRDRKLIETRGEGGMVTTVPSLHPNGKRYQIWQGSLLTVPTVTANELSELLAYAGTFDQSPPKPIYTGTSRIILPNQSRAGEYARRNLERWAAGLAAQSGDRNNRLNEIAFMCGKYAGAGMISEAEVEQALYNACLQNGLIPDDGEQAFAATLRSGLEKGKTMPFIWQEQGTVSLRAVHPPLTEQQVNQVAGIVHRLAEAAYWRGYRDGMTDAQRQLWLQQPGIQESHLGIYDFGYCAEREAFTIPIYDLGGEVVDIEYRTPGGYEYVGWDTPAGGVVYSEFLGTLPDTSKPTLILTDALTAHQEWLYWGTAFNMAYLPKFHRANALAGILPAVNGGLLLLFPDDTAFDLTGAYSHDIVRLPQSLADMRASGITEEELKRIVGV